MIDNLLLETRFAKAVEVRVRQRGQFGRVHRKLVPDRRLKRMLEWQRVAGPGFWVGWCEETRAAQLLLSIPRIHNVGLGGSTSNFPLHDFSGADEMRLDDTASEIVGLLGLTGVVRGQVPLRALHLQDWIVRRIAYAADVYMEEAAAFVGEAAALQRKRQTQVKTWGQPGRAAHATQWEAGGVRVQFYRKDLQLRRRIAHLRTGDDDLARGQRSHLEQVAVLATNIVRFEVTLGNLRAIRSALDIEPPFAPTFRLMARREAGDYAPGRELNRLRLLGVQRPGRADGEGNDDAPPLAPEPQRERARIKNLYERFLRGQADYNASAQGRRNPISSSRLRSLFATYTLLGAYSPAELLDRFGYARSTLSKDLRQLDELGLPPAGVGSIDIQSSLEQYMERLRAVVPGLRTDLALGDEAQWDVEGFVREVPWADDDDPPGLEKEQVMDVTADDHRDLLDEVLRGL